MAEEVQELTDQEFFEIKQRVEKAFPGPWYFDPDWEQIWARIPVEDANLSFDAIDTTVAYIPEDMYDSARFAAHARTDVPRLISEVERLKRTIQQKEVEVRKIRKALEWIWEMQDLFYTTHN